MRIAYTEESAKISGAGRVTEAFLRHLRGTSIRPYFVSPGPGPMADSIRALGVPVSVLNIDQPSWSDPLRTLRHWHRWSRFIATRDLDLVHANGFLSARSAILSARWRQVPLLCHLHFVFDSEACRWVFRRLPKPVGFVFCSTAVRDQMGPLLKDCCPAARQWVVNNCVDAERFRPSENINDITRVGIIGNLQRIKGHECFLKMAQILVQRGYQARFDIVGGETQEGGRLDALKAYAARLGLRDAVCFHGHVDAVERLIPSLDIVVCSSKFESFSLAVIEAMACGKPVVAPRIGVMPQLVEHQVTGLIVAPRTPQQLAAAVARLIDDPPLARAMGAKGRARVMQRFGMQAYCDSILSIYRHILSMGRL